MPVNPTTYSTYQSTPNPNTQPIYPRVPIDWRCNLTTQVTPRNIANTGNVSPVFLGQAGESGAIIEAIKFCSLVTGTPVDPGSGGGDPTESTEYGLGTVQNPMKVRIYSKRFGDETLWYEGDFVLDPTKRDQIASGNTESEGELYPILPSPQGAWRLAPYEELYVGLSFAIVSPGLNVFAKGGQYS